ncbi:YkvA family protein [Carboxydochorda subterranea]|uniref:YkvA family protein n=1 Tax=Carboxydichorda subterranea TaxID=3109565 RepID=A0ABZ1C111_9FIRM|nr:YkvA family protein [Limnochorda sp. L945t]WRP18775.1 YkvA family protein [Limnochorda sp. L945t]
MGQLIRETAALFLAYRDPRVPWYAKAWAALVLAYALSPIDLIPDPIPVLGQLDDLLLVPVGVLIALRLIPPAVMAEAREKAAKGVVLPASRAGGVIVVVLWVVTALLVAWAAFRAHLS